MLLFRTTIGRRVVPSRAILNLAGVSAGSHPLFPNARPKCFWLGYRPEKHMYWNWPTFPCAFMGTIWQNGNPESSISWVYLAGLWFQTSPLCSPLNNLSWPKDMGNMVFFRYVHGKLGTSCLEVLTCHVEFWLCFCFAYLLLWKVPQAWKTPHSWKVSRKPIRQKQSAQREVTSPNWAVGI